MLSLSLKSSIGSVLLNLFLSFHFGFVEWGPCLQIGYLVIEVAPLHQELGQMRYDLLASLNYIFRMKFFDLDQPLLFMFFHLLDMGRSAGL